MKYPLLATVLFGLSGLPTLAQEAGDRVFVTSKEVALRKGKQITGKVSRGQTLTVRSVNGRMAVD